VISRCDGAGACKSEIPSACNGYACDGTTRCRTSCTAESDCAAGYSCEASKCTPKAAKCGEGGSTVITPDGKETPCGNYRCRGGACVETCTVTADDCVGGYLCDNGKCVPASAAPTADEGGCGFTGQPADARGLFAILGLVLVTARRRLRT